MSRSKILITALTAVSYVLLCWAVIAAERSEGEAIEAAEIWLALVDDGKY